MKKTNKESIIVRELPYQVNKARLIEKIAELIKLKKIEGIVGLRDESDKEGMRMVVELRRGESHEVVLNNLYSQTQMQSVFGINMVALVDGRPQLLNLKTILECFLRHRRDVVTRRTLFDLAKARQRTHTLEGLTVALANIDEVIALIKAAKNPKEAKEQLLARIWPAGPISSLVNVSELALTRPDELAAEYGLSDQGYKLSPEQAQAILELRLHRLTGLEQDKITDEFKKLVELIKELLSILADPDKLLQVITDELLEIKQQFGDERRSEILASRLDLLTEDLIPDETVVVTLSREGYAKSQPLDSYQAQRRGGRGKTATNMKDEDVVESMLIASMHDTILCFSSIGKVYWLRVFQLPLASRTARGRPIVNLLPLSEGEQINAILPVREYDDDNIFLWQPRKVSSKKRR